MEDDHCKSVLTKYENYLENGRLGDMIKEFQNSLVVNPVFIPPSLEEQKPAEVAESSLGKRDPEQLEEMAEAPPEESETNEEMAEKCDKAWLEEEVCSWQSLRKKVKSEVDSEYKRTDTIGGEGKSEDDIISILSGSELSGLSRDKPRSSGESGKSKSPQLEGYNKEYNSRRFELLDQHLGKKGRHPMQS